MSIEQDNIEKFSIRLLVQNAMLGSILANAHNKPEIAATLALMAKDLLSSLAGVGASEEILRYAERQINGYEELLRWDGKGQRPHLH